MVKVVSKNYVSLAEFCAMLSVSYATGQNWLKLEKIIPQKFYNNKPYFSVVYVKDFIRDLKNGKNNTLKARRNKHFTSGFCLYKDYISAKSKNLVTANNLLKYVANKFGNLDAEIVNELIAYYSEQIIKNADKQNYKKYKYLIDNISSSENFINKYQEFKEFEFKYNPQEDILGLLYLSLSNIGTRKSSGSYYTPTKVVEKLVKQVFQNYKKGLIIDPCCGSGNFVLQLPKNISPEFIYAADIDEICVKIARINFALKYKIYDKQMLYSHIKVQNFLTDKINTKYDYIIGNPPWAYDFSTKELKKIQKKYITAQGTGVESYDVITEQALGLLKDDGILAFVLPEALLNVKSHKPLRKIILDNASIRYIEYLGDIFDRVQCPSIIFELSKNKKGFDTSGMKVKTKDSEFVINTSRTTTADCFNFNCNDDGYEILSKLDNIPNKVTLKNNAQFALGIVTGDNNKYISGNRTNDSEIVLKGSDIEKFKIKNPQNYIIFEPENFQQCAPTNIYRAKEKLLYKFISKELVFAYDNNKTLTLNSCNILIPQIKGLDIKYVLGILNSDVAQFYYKNKFNSLKVLRSHIEQIPIPYVNIEQQKPVINLVNKILSSEKNIPDLYKQLNQECKKLYNL